MAEALRVDTILPRVVQPEAVLEIFLTIDLQNGGWYSASHRHEEL